MKKIVIIGGGITGLATAFYLQEYTRGSVDVTLIESAPNLGGKIATAQANGFVIEGGPDSFLTRKKVMLELCRKLGLEDQLVSSNIAKRTTYVWKRGQLHPMPEGMMLMAPTMVLPFLRSRLISWPGKMRMGLEMFVPKRPRDEDDETLASFVRRRLGKEALDTIAAPLMAGIFAADPERLSLQSTFPAFLEMEQKHGSLLRGILQQRRAKKHLAGRSDREAVSSSMFTTLRAGLQQLVDAIVARLNMATILTNRHVLTVARDQEQYRITLSDSSCILADEIVITTPANVTANLVRKIDPVLAMKLRAIRYVSTATISLGFRNSDIKTPLDGSGFVVPDNENRQITACSWSSTKFKHRAPEGYTLIRTFVGGARAEALAEQDEGSLVDMVRDELRIMMGITAAPVLTKVYRWHKANPQYELGHQARVAEIDKIVAWHPGLHLAGAAYHGAGIPDCIQSAVGVAQSIARTNHTQEEGRMTEISRRLFVSGNGGVQVVPAVADNYPHSTQHSGQRDFAKNPMLVYWEMTHACALACRHCRAEAVSAPHPSELTHTESENLLRQIAAFDKPLPHLILTGGDPLQRTDLYELIDYAHILGLTVSITPSATPDLTFDALLRLKVHGIESLGLSIDGSSAARHEAVRGVDGCFDRTIRAIKSAEELEMPVQVNTLVSQETADDLPAIYDLLTSLKVMRWSLFFLIGVGRGKMLQPVSPERGEDLMHWIYDLSRVAPFAIKTTEAPSYRRVALNRMRREGMLASEIQSTPVYRGFGIRDGHGIMFVSNKGDIYPAGFLPLTVGNVRRDHLVDVYRNSPMFRALHTAGQFRGKCGRCEYGALCGGSRARAFAYTGDPLASDPFCPHEPKVRAVAATMVS